MDKTKLFVFTLACFNLALYAARAIVAGQTLNNEVYTESGDYPNDFGPFTEIFLVVYTLPACTTGGAASIFALIHVSEWTKASRLVALGLALLGMFADFLDMSHAAKQWQLGSDDTVFNADGLDNRLHFIGVGAVVGATTQMLMVAALFFFKLTTTTTTQADAGEMTDEHHEEEGVPEPETKGE